MVLASPKPCFHGQQAPPEGPVWCYMAPRGFIRTLIVTKRSPNNNTRVPKGHPGSPKNRNFSANHAGFKTATSSPVGPYRGTNLGKSEIAPKSPVIGWGFHIADKSGMGYGYILGGAIVYNQAQEMPYMRVRGSVSRFAKYFAGRFFRKSCVKSCSTKEMEACFRKR